MQINLKKLIGINLAMICGLTQATWSSDELEDKKPSRGCLSALFEMFKTTKNVRKNILQPALQTAAIINPNLKNISDTVNIIGSSLDTIEEKIGLDSPENVEKIISQIAEKKS